MVRRRFVSKSKFPANEGGREKIWTFRLKNIPGLAEASPPWGRLSALTNSPTTGDTSDGGLGPF